MKRLILILIALVSPLAFLERPQPSPMDQAVKVANAVITATMINAAVKAAADLASRDYRK